MDLNDRQSFLDSGDLAHFLGFPHISSMHMSTPLAFVFIGFGGDGNLGVNYTTERIQGWFQHLDHTLSHTRIESSELSCAEDGYCAGLVHGHLPPQIHPVHSSVKLNFTSQIIVTRTRAVAAAFERAIHVFSRPVDPEHETGHFHVDASKMEAFISHFVTSLGLDRKYTILVLNPTWSTTQPSYGYRQGLSAPELKFLSSPESKGLLQRAFDSVDDYHSDPPTLPPLDPSLMGGKRWFGSFIKGGPGVSHKFKAEDATALSDRWTAAIEPYLKKEEDVRSSILRNLGPGARGKMLDGASGAATALHIAMVLRGHRGGPYRGGPQGSSGVLRGHRGGPYSATVALSHGSPEAVTSHFHTMHPSEDCLVAHWVGSTRWLMLDLTAESSEYGPASGGQGVVHKHTLPRVQEYFEQLEEVKAKLREGTRGIQGSFESELKVDLSHKKAQAQARVTGEEHKAFMIKRQAWEHSSRAPGAAPVDTTLELKAWKRKLGESLARAKLETLEAWALEKCHNVFEPPYLCADVKVEVDELRAQLSKAASSGITSADLFPSHMWDIFGMHELDDSVHDTQNEATRAHDAFMAELSSVLSKAIRHVISPPTAVWRHLPLSRPLSRPEPGGTKGNDLTRGGTALPYSRKVRFVIHTVVEKTRTTHWSSEDKTLEFDMVHFKDQIESLRIKNSDGHSFHQQFEFSFNKLNLMEDPDLAMAFAVSMRSSKTDIPSEHAVEPGVERLWLDSSELSHHVRRNLKIKASAEIPPGEESGEILIVPIVIAELHRSSAVLIDEHYSAKSLEDFILVVQNAAREDEHPTGFMCQGSLLSRPLSPLKEALGAVLTHLGGILPTHIGYDPSRRVVTHDWLWSVGAHPFSSTSVGLNYTDTQRDALHRGYVLDALDLSIERVNQGIDLLRAARATHELHAHVLKRQAGVRTLALAFSDVAYTWRTMVGVSSDFDWAVALDLLPILAKRVDQFYMQSVDLSKAVEHLRCKGRKISGLDSTQTMISPLLNASALVALLAVLFAVIPIRLLQWPLKAKVKRRAY